MRIDFDSPPPGKPASALDVALGLEGRPLVSTLALGLMGLLALGAAGLGLASRETAAPREAVAAPASFPFSERDSVAGCGKLASGISACLSSEESLRPSALSLWGSSPAELRQACLRDRGVYEPVGKLYTCLALGTGSVQAR